MCRECANKKVGIRTIKVRSEMGQSHFELQGGLVQNQNTAVAGNHR